MKAGSLRHRVLVEKPTDTQDASGAVALGFTCVAIVWASVEPLRGRETLLAEQITAQMDTRIRMRWSPPLDCMTAKWRLRFKDVIYNIQSIAHIGHRQREIEVMCSSGANRG